MSVMADSHHPSRAGDSPTTAFRRAAAQRVGLQPGAGSRRRGPRRPRYVIQTDHLVPQHRFLVALLSLAPQSEDEAMAKLDAPGPQVLSSGRHCELLRVERDLIPNYYLLILGIRNPVWVGS